MMTTLPPWPLRLSALPISCLLLASVLLTGCGREQATPVEEVARPVKVITLGSPETGLARTFPGTVRAAERADLAFQVSGKLIELEAKEGDEVKAEQVLARLDPRDFESTVKAAQAQFLEAKSNYERGQELVKDGFISKVDFDRLRARFDTTSADLAKAKKALDDTYLKAPFSGRVARRFVENFQEVQAKQNILSLQNLAVLEVVVDAPERLIATRRQTDPNTLRIVGTFESLPGREFDLVIKEFATVADPRTQTFQYVLVMPKPEGANILPGMTANVTVTRPETAAGEDFHPEGFTIPALAVFADEAGRSHVWVVNPQTDTVHKRPVTTGELTGTASITIVEGLKPGETIAIAGVSQLREGVKIRPVTEILF